MKILSLTAILITSAIAASPPRNETSVLLTATEVKNLGIETVAAEESDFERTIPMLGEIEHTCESHSMLSSRIAGKIVEVSAHKGDFVKKGDVLLRVESRQPGNPPPVIELTAPADGLVTRSNGHLGAPVEPDQELMEIIDLTKVWVIAHVPQHHAALLKDGLQAQIRIPSLGTEKITSTLLQLNPQEKSNPATLEAVFEIPNPESKLRPGMRAEVSLISSKRENVLGIPRGSLQGNQANRYVFIKDYELENTFVKNPVTIGEISDEKVEIVSGLFPGDEVVVKGSYALSYAGKGSVSLKEALDAAHGHPHNEDGTEMTAEQIAAAKGEHDHHNEQMSPLVIFLTITCGVLLVLLIASVFYKKSQANQNHA
jgi:cobalt-zinc-cadmium efflux system membrane fusion protein